jgi:hypothetical protein
VAQFTLKSPRVKVLKILEDLAGRSNVFVSFGAIAHGEIESWMRAASLTIPSDLIEFWCQTGGGDLFDDSETMLRPTRIPSSYPGFLQGDDIESATQFCIQNGMPASYLLFHSGTPLPEKFRRDYHWPLREMRRATLPSLVSHWKPVVLDSLNGSSNPSALLHPSELSTHSNLSVCDWRIP